VHPPIGRLDEPDDERVGALAGVELGIAERAGGERGGELAGAGAPMPSATAKIGGSQT
jgi:hypothetical protein